MLQLHFGRIQGIQVDQFVIRSKACVYLLSVHCWATTGPIIFQSVPPYRDNAIARCNRARLRDTVQ